MKYEIRLLYLDSILNTHTSIALVGFNRIALVSFNLIGFVLINHSNLDFGSPFPQFPYNVLDDMSLFFNVVVNQVTVPGTAHPQRPCSPPHDMKVLTRWCGGGFWLATSSSSKSKINLLTLPLIIGPCSWSLKKDNFMCFYYVPQGFSSSVVFLFVMLQYIERQRTGVRKALL